MQNLSAAHRQISASIAREPRGVIDVLIPGEATVDRLP
jgi:hypothetical protein